MSRTSSASDMSVNYSTLLTENSGSNLRLIANRVDIQNWGAAQNSNLALSQILASSNHTTIMTMQSSNIQVTAHIRPTSCNVFDLGSSNFRFRDLYLSGDTIDLDGLKLSKDSVTGGLVVRGTGNIPVDTTSCNVIASGNIGIGTTNAISKLTVSGGPVVISRTNVGAVNNSVSSLIIRESGATNTQASITLSATNTGGIALNSNEGLVLATQNGYVAFRTSVAANGDFSTTGTEVMRVLSGGNVGIGTTNALRKLHVQGDINFTGSLYQSNVLYVSSQWAQAGGVASNLYYNDGNVGIGTTSPLRKLHVQGDINFTGSLYQNNSLYVSSQWTTGSSNALYYTDGNVGVGTTTPLSPMHVVGDATIEGQLFGVAKTRRHQVVHIQTSGTSTDYEFGLNVGFGAGAKTVIGGGEATAVILANEASTTEELILAADNSNTASAIRMVTNLQAGYASRIEAMTIVGNGNVGIGTTTPLAKMHVYHGTSAGDILRVDDEAAPDTTPFIIKEDGNVGIGTNNPLEKVHVAGAGIALTNATNPMIEVGSNVSGSNLTLGYATAVNGIASGTIMGDAVLRTDLSGNKVHVMAGTGAPVLSVTSANVGIGSTNPATKLHVVGTVRADTQFQAISSDSQSIPGYSWEQDADTGMFRAGADAIAFTTAATEKVRIASDGNVGVGINAPTQKLHVSGNILATGTVFASNLSIIGDFVTMNTVTSNTEQMVINNAGTGPALKVIQSGANAVAEFYDSEVATPALFIADNGNVGIGTSTVTQKLRVEGTVLATAFSGNGASVTAINANNISAGTLDNARTSATNANTASTIVLRDATASFVANAITATTFSGNGASVTAINANNISAGTLDNARTSATNANTASTIVLRDATASFVANAITATTFSGNGASITAINANNISTGTLANGRTSATNANNASTIVLRDATASFAANAITATTFIGNGASITAINADNITTGSLDNALTSAVSTNTASTIVLRDANGGFNAGAINAVTFAGNGASITAINANNISAGTLDNARTSATNANTASTIVLRDATASFVANAITATTFSGNGASITAINASRITTGTLDNARTSAVSTNTASTLVLRDANGGFAAGSIIANGDVGIGTATPTYRLSVFDGTQVTFVAGIDTQSQNFPPIVMTANTTTLANTTRVGWNGTYIASSSSNSLNQDPYLAFDGSTSTFWQNETANTRYTGTNFDYTGTTLTIDDGGISNLGEWLQIQLPYNIIPSSVTLQNPTYNGSPDSFVALASTNGTTWKNLGSSTLSVSNASRSITVTAPNNQTEFKYFRTVVRSLTSNVNPLRIYEMRISGYLPNDNRIGIGTTLPTANMHVIGDIKSTGVVAAAVQFQGQANDTASAPSFTWEGDSDTGMYRPAANNIGFGIQGAEMMRILADGNIGIGSTQPVAKLDVGGQVRATTFSGNGASIAAINANNISAGTLDNARTSAVSTNTASSIVLRGTTGGFAAGPITVTGAVTATTFSGNGASITALNAGNIATGTLAVARGGTGVTTSTGTGAVVLNTSPEFATSILVYGATNPYMRVGIGTTYGISIGCASANGSYATGALIGDVIIRSEDSTKRLHLQSGLTQVMTITNANVGIGTTNPLSKLAVDGAIIASGDITAFGTASDARLKTNVKNLEFSLDSLCKLRPVEYQWRDDIFNEAKRGVSDVGFIAQEVSEVLPLVTKDIQFPNVVGTYKGIEYDKIIPYLTKAVQELVVETKRLGQEVAELKSHLH